MKLQLRHRRTGDQYPCMPRKLSFHIFQFRCIRRSSRPAFGEENVNAYYLEYDDERSGGFAPLAKVSGDKKVVLGLVTTKSPVLEKKEDVIARIHEAAKHVPLDRLYLSPQCGFASCEIGNKLTEEEQWAKLKLVKEIAEEVWR